MGPIIRSTFKEMFRRRILQITVFVTLLYLTLYGVALHYTAQSIHRASGAMIRSFLVPQLTAAGLYFGSVILSFFAILSLVGTISGEIESGVMHTVATSPVRRSSIVLGKLIGYCTVLLAYAGILFAGVILAVKLVAGAEVHNLAAAFGTFALEPLLLAALAMLGSTFLSTIANSVTMFSLYAISLIGGVAEQIGVLTRSAVLSNAGIISSLIVPADAMYRKTVSLVLASTSNPLSGLMMIGPFGAQLPPNIWMVVWSLLYLVGCVGLASLLFSRKEI
jgi:ABC-type transport system involved in multi-copper enzyme maturation permease subunit